MKTKEIRKTKIQEKRDELKKLSAPIKKRVQNGEVERINMGLKEIYKMQGHVELHTLRQWNKQGMYVKKGEKALMLWGCPRKIEKLNAETAELDKLDFYPICFLFSNLQVIEKGGAQ